MKKIYLAALTLAMTACVSNDDLNPVDNYGYIDVNVSNDPVMVTRAEGEGLETVTNLEGWNVVATAQSGDKTYTLPSSVPPKIYSVNATCKNYADISTACNVAIQDGEQTFYYGAPYYEGTFSNNNYNVSSGQTCKITIPCGKAQNCRVKLVNSLNTSFSNVSITIDAITKNSETVRNSVTLSGDENKNIAYYEPRESLDYTINYTFGNSSRTQKVENYTIGAEGTENVITLTSNNNGQIIVSSITYDKNFTDGTPQELIFDAATGNQVTE